MRALAGLFIAVSVLGMACTDRDGTFGRDSTPSAVPTQPADDTADRTPTPSPTAPISDGHARFDSARALDHVRALSEQIGERLSGTAGEDAAAAYIAGELESYGYEVEIQGFEFAPERFGLSFVEVPEGELAALKLEGSATGEVTGEAVYVGLAQPDEVGAVAVAGKIAIADRGVISFNAKYRELLDAGAIGLVIINSDPGPLGPGNLDTTARFPVVSVAGLDGPALRTLAESGGELTIRVPESDVGTALNVFAQAPENDRCLVLVGGHHDTVPAAPGANDNASGVANVLEIARAMAADGLDEGLCFATFGAEEHGLFGSARMASELAGAGALPELMVNLDVTGIGERVEVIGDQRPRTAAIEIGLDLEIETVASQLPANSGSDHQSFAAEGVEVVFFTSGAFGTIHSPRDTFDAVEEDELERIGRVALQLIVDELGRIAGD